MDCYLNLVLNLVTKSVTVERELMLVLHCTVSSSMTVHTVNYTANVFTFQITWTGLTEESLAQYFNFT